MKTKNKRDFLRKVARMYYIQGITQQEIADEMNVGRSSVARFLSEAKELGIVTFSIESDTDNFRNKELEARLIKKFHLTDCLVSNSEDGIVDDLAVEYLDEILPYKGVIGVTGGKTTYSLGQKLWGVVERQNLNVVQMLGSISDLPETSVTKLYADALGARGTYLPAPLLVKDIETRNVLTKDPLISSALAEMKKIETAIVGIGCNKANDNIKYLKLYDFIDIDRMYKNTIGDIGFHFFDSKGKFKVNEIEERLIGISIEDYLQIKQRIGIAYNEKKAAALAVILQSGLINTLITNSRTVQAILERSD